MSLEIYQAIVDTASAVGSLVAVCLAYKAFDVSRNISDHEQDNERTRLTIDALNKLQDEVLSKIYWFFCKCWGRRKQRSFGKNQMRTAF